MYYSDEIIEEVRAGTDIIDLVSSYVKLTKRGANHLGLCPFHNEKTPSFTVNQSKQIFHCFGCGAGGNVFTFLMKYENMGFIEALKFLSDRAGIPLPEWNDEKAKRYADQRTKLFEINREAARFYHGELIGEKGGQALAYLRERGLSDYTIKTFGLGFSPKGMAILYQLLKDKGFDDESLKSSGLFIYKEEKGPSDRFWNRVMFPIIDFNGKVIGFGGRVMGDGKPKYLNSPETNVFQKGRNLFSLNFAKVSKEAYFILCEGYLDVIALYQAGFTSAVASLGTALTPDQARLISKYTKTLFLMYDSDDAGVKAIMKAIPILKDAGIVAKIVNLSPFKDPDELLKKAGKEELKRRMESAISSFEFELKLGEKEKDISIPEERLALIRKMAERLVDMENKLERENYLSMLAERYQLSTDVLRESVNQIGLQKEIQDGFRDSEERIRSKKEMKAAEGLLKSEKILISSVAERPKMYQKIKMFIEYQDFSEPLTREIVEKLFGQIECGNEPKPAVLISQYETEKEQQEVASLFGETSILSLDEEAFLKAFSETVLKVKKASIERRMNEAAKKDDMNWLLQLIEEQKKLSETKILLP